MGVPDPPGKGRFGVKHPTETNRQSYAATRRIQTVNDSAVCQITVVLIRNSKTVRYVGYILLELRIYREPKFFGLAPLCYGLSIDESAQFPVDDT